MFKSDKIGKKYDDQKAVKFYYLWVVVFLENLGNQTLVAKDMLKK